MGERRGDILAIYCITVLHLEKAGTTTGIPRFETFHAKKTMYTDYTRKGNMGILQNTLDFKDLG